VKNWNIILTEKDKITK